MGQKTFRVGAVTVCVALAGVAMAAPQADASDAALGTGPVAQQWSFAKSELPQLAQAREQRIAQQVMEAKLALRAQATAADAAYDASAGKASEAARRALAVERNQALVAVVVTEALDDVAPAGDGITAAVDTVTAEVAAWEAAEAKRKAEEAAKAAAAQRGSRTSRGGGGAAPTGDPKAYLDGIASSYGTWVQWGPQACGRGGGTKVSGCFTGGDFVIVSDSAYSSWSVAKGRGRNVVLHEISHLLIQRKCGTVYVSDRFENVTDAYAVLIGASNHTGYGYNDTDMALAQNIRGGSCSL